MASKKEEIFQQLKALFETFEAEHNKTPKPQNPKTPLNIKFT